MKRPSKGFTIFMLLFAVSLSAIAYLLFTPIYPLGTSDAIKVKNIIYESSKTVSKVYSSIEKNSIIISIYGVSSKEEQDKIVEAVKSKFTDPEFKLKLIFYEKEEKILREENIN